MIIQPDQIPLTKTPTGDVYDGHLLHRRFAYQYHGDLVQRTGNVITFVAPTHIKADDLVHEIKVSKALIIACELPDTDLFGGVCFQRLYTAQLGSLICSKLGVDGHADRHKIFVGDKPASVSNVNESKNATLIQSIIFLEGGPEGCYNVGMWEQTTKEIMRELVTMFYQTTRDIFITTQKVAYSDH